MIPKRLGGYETTIKTQLEVTAALGEACGSTAWVAALTNVCAWFTGLFFDQAQRDVFGADPDARVAGVFAPSTGVEKVDGGYRVSGKWAWSSGSLHATWAYVGVLQLGPEGPIDMGVVAHADERAVHRGHLVRRRHEGHRQQHRRGRGRLRARAPLHVDDGGLPGHLPDRAHRRGALPGGVHAVRGAHPVRPAARPRPRGAEARDREGAEARRVLHAACDAGGVHRLPAQDRRGGDDARRRRAARAPRAPTTSTAGPRRASTWTT